MTIAKVIYLLCGFSCLSCTFLLYRHYLRTGIRLLFWSAVSFVLLSASNVLLYFDLVVTEPTTDLSLFRGGITLLALMILITNLISESMG